MLFFSCSPVTILCDRSDTIGRSYKSNKTCVPVLLGGRKVTLSCLFSSAQNSAFCCWQRVMSWTNLMCQMGCCAESSGRSSKEKDGLLNWQNIWEVIGRTIRLSQANFSQLDQQEDRAELSEGATVRQRMTGFNQFQPMTQKVHMTNP